MTDILNLLGGTLTVYRDGDDRVWINNGGEYYSRLQLDDQYIRIDAIRHETSLTGEGITLRKVWTSGPDA
jgi:hypothetical protein